MRISTVTEYTVDLDETEQFRIPTSYRRQKEMLVTRLEIRVYQNYERKMQVRPTAKGHPIISSGEPGQSWISSGFWSTRAEWPFALTAAVDAAITQAKAEAQEEEA